MRGLITGKEDFILRQCKSDVKVLHVGCANSPNHVARWESGSLLHKKLVRTVESSGGSCIGIDIDSEAVRFLSQKMPDADLRVMDASSMDKYFEPEFDLVVAGDIIEHLANPGLFLRACRSVMNDSGRLLITTTNAFGVIRFGKALLLHEAVHAEHTAYYSHKTLRRLLSMEGMEIIEAGYYRSEPVTYFNLNRVISNSLEHLLCLLWPNFAEGIVVLATRAGQEDHPVQG